MGVSREQSLCGVRAEVWATFAFHRREVSFYCHSNSLLAVGALGHLTVMPCKSRSPVSWSGLAAKLAEGPVAETFLWSVFQNLPQSLSLGKNMSLLPSGLGPETLSPFCHLRRWNSVTASTASSFPGCVLKMCDLPARVWLLKEPVLSRTS